MVPARPVLGILVARRFSTHSEQPAVDKVIDFGRDVLKKKAQLYLGVGGVLVLGLSYAWYKESEWCITKEMRNVFECGGPPGWDTVAPGWDIGDSFDKLLERPALVSDLQALFRPDKKEHLYHVIMGDEGTGKTTAIRGALRSLASPKAVVYCEVGSAESFVNDLAKAVGYRPSFSVRARVWRWIQGENFKSPMLTWVELKSKLDEVAKITPQPLVIVLDSADRLFEKDPDFFSELQRDAKAAADRGSPIYVFVLTKGRGLALLRSHSEWSRAALPFEVRDVADDEAIKLLLAKHGTMQLEEAEEAVRTITGGRFHLLYSFPAPASKSIEEYRSEKFDATEANLNTVGLNPTHPFFARLFTSTSKRIPGSTATALLEEGQLSKLLEKKILSVRSDGSYAFNSRHVESFFTGECWRILSFLLLSCLLPSGLIQFCRCCRCVQRDARTGT
jgi:hypothetical protein